MYNNNTPYHYLVDWVTKQMYNNNTPYNHYLVDWINYHR